MIKIYSFIVAIAALIQIAICAKSKDILLNTAIPLISLIMTVYIRIMFNHSTGNDAIYYNYIFNGFALILLSSIVPLIAKAINKLIYKK